MAWPKVCTKAGKMTKTKLRPFWKIRAFQWMKWNIEYLFCCICFSHQKSFLIFPFLTTDASVETCPKLDNDESVAQYHYFNLGCFGKSNIFVDHCDLHFCRPWDAAVCQNIYSGELCSRSCAKVTNFMFIPC